jgi:general secretion pathway protein K
LLRRLFTSAGIRDDAASALVDAIGDWRDADDLKRLNGAEADDYRSAGYPYGPRNAAFESVDELGQVLGMNDALLERVRPALTIFFRRSQFDPATAPRAALEALNASDASKAAEVASVLSGSIGASSSAGTTVMLPQLAGRAFTIRARAATQRGVEAKLAATVRFTNDAQASFWVHAWE